MTRRATLALGIRRPPMHRPVDMSRKSRETWDLTDGKLPRIDSPQDKLATLARTFTRPWTGHRQYAYRRGLVHIKPAFSVASILLDLQVFKDSSRYR